MKKQILSYSLALVASMLPVVAYQCPLIKANDNNAGGEWDSSSSEVFNNLKYRLFVEFSSSANETITGGEVYLFCNGGGGVDSMWFPTTTSYDYIDETYFKTSYEQAAITMSEVGDSSRHATAVTEGAP